MTLALFLRIFKLKKLLYLFLALLLPALVFVFLKYAGRNEFNIPVYFENGVLEPPSECGVAYPSPYRVPDSVWQRRSITLLDANVLVFPKEGLVLPTLKSKIEGEFGKKDVAFIETSMLTVDSATSSRLRKCVFFVDDPWETVLIDREGRIRGYYDLLSREDEDRLRVELKVLLKKY